MKVMIGWKAGALASALLVAAAPALGADAHKGDPEQGKKVFRVCLACHSTDPGINRVGPTLYDIIGRKAGTVEGFNYSRAHRESGIVWTRKTLDSYLKDPRSYIPNNRMMFSGVKNDRQRADLIAYLASDEVSPGAPDENDGGTKGQ